MAVLETITKWLKDSAGKIKSAKERSIPTSPVNKTATSNKIELAK